tara:strand:- start:79 stop:519 length:441 start_codon:yes stop_codon:yes gene_type:complete
MEKNMKQSKDKLSLIGTFVNSISVLDTDNSDNLTYSTQGRVLRGACYNYTNELRYLNGTYRQHYAEWAILKEDSRGDESTAAQLNKKNVILHDTQLLVDDFTELRDAAYKLHLELFGKDYVLPIKGSKMVTTRQEIDTDWSPKAPA